MSTASSFDYGQPEHIVQPISSRQTDLEAGSGPAKAVLKVIDAHYDGTEPVFLKQFSYRDKIAEDMKNLPPHAPRTARILDVTVHSDFKKTGLRETKGPKTTEAARRALVDHLEELYATSIESKDFVERRIFRWLSDPLLVNDIGSITSQWSQTFTGSSTSLYRLVNRASLQQHPLDRDVRPRDSYFTCAQCDEDRLIVIIVNDVESNQRFITSKARKATGGEVMFKNPRVTSQMRNGTSLTSHANGSRDVFAQLLVLDFFLASIYLQPVDYYESLIYPQLDEKDAVKFSLTKNPHLQVPLGLFEPRLSAKSREAFKEIEDAEGVLRSVHNLVASIVYVRDILEESDFVVQQPKDSELKLRLLKLKALCAERNSNAERALAALERQLDYLTKKHAIREAKAIRILTILAAFYLPLSLSASMLGMQSPFKQVAHTIRADELSGDRLGDRNLNTNLLFDFFGVFILLGTITIFIVQAIRFAFWMRSNGMGLLSESFTGPFSIFQYGKQWRFGGRGGWWFRRIHLIMLWWLGPGVCLVLLVTFMNGMLVDAQKAWDTARYLFATYILGGGLLILFYFGFYYFLCRKRLSVR